MIYVNSCPICAGQQFTDFISCKDFTTTGETFEIKKCNSCSFTFTNPQPDEKSIGKYYLSSNYISHTGGKKNITDRIYLLARKWALKKKRNLIENISDGNSILDYGCGTGEFMSEMKKNGWEASGIEPSQIAREKSEKLNQTKVFIQLEEIENKKFDVITLWHVLEHIHDLNRTMEGLTQRMKDSSALIIAVPNLKSYDAEHYKSFWAAYDVPRHLWHFNQENMKQLLKNHGLKIVQVSPMKLDSYYVSMLSELYKNPKKNKFVNLFSAIITGLKSNMKARKSGNYSSLIYIATK